jgi:tight adherence protein C
LISAAAFASVAAVAAVASVVGLVGEAQERRGSRSGAGPLRARLAAIGWTAALAAAVSRAAARLPVPALSGARELEARLAAAGRPLGLGASEWAASRSICALAGMGVASTFAADASTRNRLLSVATGAVVGFVLPQLWLRRQIESRLAAVRSELPDMLDLLRVSVDAGQAPMRALGQVADQFRGLVAVEWKRASAECALGAAEARALNAMRRRLPCEEIEALCEALGRSRRHGSPLGRVLAAQAARARHRQRQRLRENAARASPKIQLTVALLMVPSVLLLVLAGLLAELQSSGVGFAR